MHMKKKNCSSNCSTNTENKQLKISVRMWVPSFLLAILCIILYYWKKIQIFTSICTTEFEFQSLKIHYTTLHFTTLHYTTLHYITLHLQLYKETFNFLLFCFVLFCFVLLCLVLFYFVLFCFAFFNNIYLRVKMNEIKLTFVFSSVLSWKKLMK